MTNPYSELEQKDGSSGLYVFLLFFFIFMLSSLTSKRFTDAYLSFFTEGNCKRMLISVD